MPLPDLLERLLTTPGPSGQERAAAAVWREAAASVGEVSSDTLGSSWVRVPGTAGGFGPQRMAGPGGDGLGRGGALAGVGGARFQKRKRGEDRKPHDYDDL